MPDCAPFRLYVGDQIAEVIRVVRSEMKQHGVSSTGTDQSGSFSIPVPGGVIRAGYVVDGKSLEVTVRSRPESLTCGTIESKMQDAILDAKNVLKRESS